MLNLEEAIALAAYQHAEQVDKAGLPYILHPLGVMISLRNAGYGDEYLMVGVLHDVFEDTDITFETFVDQFEPEDEVLHALKSLTRQEHETYVEFINRIMRGNHVARVVKEADIIDNLSRIEKIWDKNDKERLNRKYMDALSRLRGRI